MNLSHALVCQGLIKRYGSLTAVDHLDLEIPVGRCYGLLGPNGAGKTTTIEMLEGITVPDGGEIQVLGHSWRDKPDAIRQKLGIQLQETQFQGKLRVQEVLAMYGSFYHCHKSVEDLLRIISLVEKRNSFVENLSGGQKQRLALGCALAGDPDILFLDEPTTGLDPQARRQIWELVLAHKAEGKTVVITTHYMDEAQQLCDEIGIMDQGKLIAQGSPAQLIASLGGDHIIEWQVEEPIDLRESEMLAIKSAVTFRQKSATEYVLTVQQLHHALPELMLDLERRSAALQALSTHQASLEDVFLNLTGRSLREP
ncbi:MAG: ABC transporter ATP-binding protein [Acidobacteria bacterium]|nr:ABC transporter ATP-binding protein [Acidobacteriota bacterium]MCB9396328.1 ABC transporter ATP-binding protein [Acidobacteriota bacterium]